MRWLSKGLALLLASVFVASLVTFQSATVKADSPRTIVVPDDFQTLQTAIENASPGDIIHVRVGTYSGGFVIDKPIALMGEDSNNTKIVGGKTAKELGLSLVASNADNSASFSTESSSQNANSKINVQPQNLSSTTYLHDSHQF